MFETAACDGAHRTCPQLPSTPRSQGATAQIGFSRDMPRIRLRISASIFGRPVLSGSRLPSPVKPEALLVPSNHRFGTHDEQRTSPIRPETGHPSPENAITILQLWSIGRILKNSELLTKREVFSCEFRLRTKQRRQGDCNYSENAHFTFRSSTD